MRDETTITGTQSKRTARVEGAAFLAGARSDVTADPWPERLCLRRSLPIKTAATIARPIMPIRTPLIQLRLTGVGASCSSRPATNIQIATGPTTTASAAARTSTYSSRRSLSIARVPPPPVGV